MSSHTMTSRRGWTQSAVLLATVLVGFAILAPLAYNHAQESGVVACVVAAAICLAASFVALACTWLWPNQLLAAMGAGMMIRMAVPLVACLVVKQSDGEWAAAGFIYYILGFYLLTLAADTILMLPRANLSSPPGGSAGHG